MGESDEKPFRPADVTEQVRVFILGYFVYELRAPLAEPFKLVDVLHGEHDAEVAGDRLPWVRTEGNFALLRSLDWQVHVYGTLNKDFETACRNLGLPTPVFRWSDQARDAGMERDAAYFVRPDGHVSVASSEQHVRVLKPVIDRFGLKFGAPKPVMSLR